MLKGSTYLLEEWNGMAQKVESFDDDHHHHHEV
jgi:hypothetical protein